MPVREGSAFDLVAHPPLAQNPIDSPYVHPKAERAQAVDVAATTEQIEGSGKDPSKDPLYESFLAYEQAARGEDPRP